MCGRFTLTVDPGQIQETFGVETPQQMQPHYNIAPTQPVAVIPNDGKDRLDFFIWGLIPSWAKDPSIGNRLINARAETLAEKPAFRAAYRRRRCLVIADGFYEWRKEPGSKSKTPVYLQMESKEPFGFAGLWEVWYAGDGSEIRSCTIITTNPNELVANIHNRMPVVVAPEDYSLWLSPEEQNPEVLKPVLRPYPSTEMIAYPVSRLVNSPGNDVPECIEPVAM
jgi:putative SOS response-associated peptidase YedK